MPGIGLGTSPVFMRRAPFTPLVLFAAGEQGVWYDPSDLSTMFQDTGGTTPVTATGQSVALIRDKSGRGNHASQATASQRPTLQQDASGRYYLSFDGVDDGLATANIAFTASDKIMLAAGVRKLSDAVSGVVLETSAVWASNAGAFGLFAPSSSAANYGFASRGSGVGGSTIQAGFASPNTSVLVGLGDIANDRADLRINGTQYGNATLDQGTGNYGTYPLYIGRRAGTSAPFNGRLYGAIVRGGAVTADQLAQVETWLNAKTGAF